MYTVRRWWERRGVQITLIGLVVGGALVLRQTQGAVFARNVSGDDSPSASGITVHAHEARAIK